MNILVITEKPRVAEKLASALGKPEKKKQGKTAYYEIASGKDDILIAPAVGHVYSLSSQSKGYPVFDAQWVESSSVSESSAFTKAYLDVLKKLGKKADVVINACDFDLEGSVIGYNIARFAAPGKPAKRMKFSTLTNEELRDAFDNASALDKPNALAGEARHYLDWFYGINLSRALMSSLKKAGLFRIMSVGRVQGPTLHVLAEREREISAFTPEPYWQLFALIKDVEFAHEKDKFFNKAEADALFAKAKGEATIEAVETRTYESAPPTPFDLTTMQVESYRAFGFSPSQTLALAQELYEAGLISYPRTSSQQLNEKLGLKKIMEHIAKQSDYAAMAQQLLQQPLKPNNGEKSDPAHPAIYPTGSAPGVLSPQQRKLYDLVVKRFMATFALAAQREKMKVSALIGGERFIAEGARTVFEGWTAFYAPYAEFKEEALPTFREGEKCAANVSMEEKQTLPPKRYSEASLIKKLEAEGLGTKATRSEIIQTLYDRGYIAEKQIRTTALGLAVATALEHHVPEILSEQLTRQFEEEIEAIQEGKKDQEAVLEEGKKFLTKTLADVKKKELEIGKDLLQGVNEAQKQESLLGDCIVCGKGKIVIKKSRFGYFAACNAYPECKTTYPLPKMAKIEPLRKACEKCGTPMIKVIRKARRPFNMCLLPSCETKKDWGKPASAQPTESASSSAPQAPVVQSPQPTAPAQSAQAKPKSSRKKA